MGLETPPPYFSAAFQLGETGVMYQVKLRRTPKDPLFAVVQPGSRLLEMISPGCSMDLLVYAHDRDRMGVNRQARIAAIKDGGDMGFKNHVVVSLDMIDTETEKEE